ncbi:hypothetical protein BSL78_23667 [Apostichopus japonicus]|uniref:Uncharacterized protein n=1 Tax=Stichopus japonicus TaxID=307972 RepID=A0A2G8JUS9_STIJA|nr:hypothetical protein BSL78_23667 [Apostichopus japonicus]
MQHYDVSDDGSLIIKSVGRNQTGPYTILHFMEDYESERDTVFITLIVTCDDLEIINDGHAPILVVTCVIAILIIVTTTLLFALYCGRRCKRNMKNEDEDGDLKEIDPLIDRFLKTQLQIETPKGERKQMSAASFFDSDVEWKNTKRILFVGDFLTEDSPIVKQANSKCYQENFDETLFIVDIKKLNFEANFANELHKQLPPNSKYSLEKINDILSLEKCWLILDGGGEPLELTKSPDSEEDIDVDKFTTFDLLYNYGGDLLRVWVTSIPSVPRNNFSDYTKIYLPKSNENESHSSITNL